MTTKFDGFNRKVRYVPVPGPLLGVLLEQIDDLAELKCTLRLVALLHQKRGHPRFVSLGELQADRSLARSLSGDGEPAADVIEAAIASAVGRGTVASATVEHDGRRQQLFALNTVVDRASLAKLSDPDSSGPPGGVPSVPEPWEEPADRPNVFGLYEQNIGLINPMIADELREAEELYPEDWIEDAFREAVGQNKRSWRYIARILERWEHEGRGHGRSGRNSKKTLRY
jgi:DnaD/phage-associated family protein